MKQIKKKINIISHTFVVLVSVQGIPRFPGVSQRRTQNTDNDVKKNNLLVSVTCTAVFRTNQPDCLTRLPVTDCRPRRSTRALPNPVIGQQSPQLNPHPLLLRMPVGVDRSSCNQSRGIQFSNGDPPLSTLPPLTHFIRPRNLVWGSVFCCRLPWSVVRAILWILDTLTVPNNKPHCSNSFILLWLNAVTATWPSWPVVLPTQHSRL